jgi:hypothetical protein
VTRDREFRVGVQRAWAAACFALLCGCAGTQTDDSGSPGGDPCWESPRLEYALGGELAQRVAALEGSYLEPLLWVDEAAWQAAGGLVAFPFDDPFRNVGAGVVVRDEPAGPARESRIHAHLALASESVVSFESCASPPSGWPVLEWVPMTVELRTEDGLIDERGEFWLEFGTSKLPVERGAKLRHAPARGPIFADPERPDGWIAAVVTFFDGRMFGGIFRQSPEPTDPEEVAEDAIRGHFPAVLERGVDATSSMDDE